MMVFSGCTTLQDAGVSKTEKEEVPTHSSRLVKLASDIESRGDPNTALALYEQAAAVPDAKPATLVSVADAYARAGYGEQAVKTYRLALSRAPSYGPALVGLGSAMIDEGDSEAGIRALAEGAQSVHSSKAYNRLGVAYIFAGDTDAAQTTFQKALALAPGDLDIETNMALAAALAQQSASAVLLAQKIAASPNAQLHHKRNIVVVYGLLGQESVVRASPPTGLSTKDIDTLLAQAKAIGTKKTVHARAKALGSMNG
ncbi:tetratricopeptide repeat protein [Nitratireductor soli]|uniref:tetratricopeptide repeat protein n=1 Tax=Nitratireductor soli TaxID=1670619 RepID=UPI001FCD9B08|nr:tetratricopeptide repeat protein [Nitratireductor soli]